MAASPYRLRPSAAHRWAFCYGSVALESQYPQEEGESAREGVAGHHVGTELLAGREIAEGSTAPNGVVVTDEMLDGAALFVDATFARIPPNLMHVEEALPIAGVHPDNGGTPDVWGMGYEAWVLHVIDYKFGHEFVDPFENWQCLDYVHGIVEQLCVEWGRSWHEIEQALIVEITIVQPRSYHRDGPVRSWRVRLSDLRSRFNVLRDAAALASQPNPITRVGPWCTHCEAAAHCATLQDAAYRILDISGRSVPFDLTPSQVGRELTWLRTAAKMLDARIDGLETEAKAMIARGDNVHGWRFEHEFGNLTWSEEALAEVPILGQMLDVDVYKPTALKTPTQVKTALKKKKVDDSVINEYSFRPKKAAKLVAFDERSIRKIPFGE